MGVGDAGEIELWARASVKARRTSRAFEATPALSAGDVAVLEAYVNGVSTRDDRGSAVDVIPSPANRTCVR